MADHQWYWPNGTKTEPHVNSPWGWRKHPVSGQLTFHYGTDFAPSRTFTHNKSITDGTVTKVGYVSGWYGGGNGVWVKNWDGSLAKYFHGKDGSIVVKVGQKVSAGQVLSTIGMTGSATGDHCHLEISPKGGANGQVNPEPWLRDKIASTAGGGDKPFDPKEIEVIPYHYEDALSRKSGRTVAPGKTFYLHNNLAAGTENALNIIGARGVYDIVGHVYADGAPGDTFTLVTVVQTNPATDPKTSRSYSESFTFGPTGRVLADATWKFNLAKATLPTAIYLRFEAASANKGNVNVTVLDSDAHCFIA